MDTAFAGFAMADSGIIPSWKIIEVDTSPEMVTNGTFTTDASSWTPIRCTLASTSGYLTMTRVGTGINNAATQQIYGMIPGATYQVSGYVKSGTSGDDAYYYDVYTSDLMTEIKKVQGTTSGSWVQNSDTFVNPAGNTSVWVYLVKDNDDAGTMLFDTISLKMIAPPAATDGWREFSADISAGNAAPHFITEAGDIIKLYKESAVADATNSSDVITQLNALLARLRTHGLISST